MKTEPVIIIGAIVTVLTIVQQLTLTGISPGVHAIIASVLIVLGAVLTRLQVSPTPAPIAKAKAQALKR